MEFEKDVDLPDHIHKSQWEIVLEGKVEVFIDNIKHSYKKGDRFFIPSGISHSAKIYSGYASIVIFDQKDRYRKK
jgi:quercetin dioxygenase-like cupin family protein